jgi:hypothetical protein
MLMEAVIVFLAVALGLLAIVYYAARGQEPSVSSIMA